MGLGMACRSFRRIWPMLELRVPLRLFPSRLPTLRLWSPWLLPSGVRTLRLWACEFWQRFRSRHGRGFPRRRRAPLDPPMSDIPRVVFPDYKRKLPVAMTQKGKRPSIGARGFFGTHELPGADCTKLRSVRSAGPSTKPEQFQGDRQSPKTRNGSHSRAEPEVRIHFPPAKSLQTFGSSPNDKEPNDKERYT